MFAAGDCWPADAQGSWIQGPVALGHRLLINTPESRFESQPLVVRDTDGTRVVVCDARLDNRLEVATELDLGGRSLARTSDAELIAMAWRRWGRECPRRLLGDFAFAVWDGPSRRLECVRDAVGIRPLYYYCDERLFAFASDVRSLMAIPSVPRSFFLPALAQFLREGESRSHDRTLLEAVRKVPPATVMTVSGDSVEEKVYWRLDESPRRSFASFEQCGEELQDLIRTSVRDRLRSEFPIHAHLSGGLDSSSIAVIASRELAGSGRALAAHSWVSPPSAVDSSAPESRSPSLVADAEGIELLHVSLDVAEIVRDLRETDIACGHNHGFWYENLVQRSVAEAGGRTVLSGWGGDELISSPGASVHADLFWHGRPVAAVRDMLAEAFSDSRWPRRLAKLLFGAVVLPVVPAPLRRGAARAILGGAQDGGLLQPQFAALVATQPLTLCTPPPGSQRGRQLYLFGHGHLQSRVEGWAASAWSERVEYRYPLLDRRILEFAVSVPSEYFRGRGVDRRLFREAVRSWLPAQVRLARTKREPGRVRELLNLEARAISERVEDLFRGGVSGRGSLREDLVSIEGVRRAAERLQRLPEVAERERIILVEQLLAALRLLVVGNRIE
jgi:asparagine synthase (glutamine-hydrolysing)